MLRVLVPVKAIIPEKLEGAKRTTIVVTLLRVTACGFD